MVSINKYKKMIRPLDVILIATFLLVSFIPVGVFAWQQSRIPEGASLVAIITINGDEVDRFTLNEQTQHLVTYTADDGLIGTQFNIVEIDGARIRVKQDNSPDQIGVMMGWISRPGQTIIVLPHRFLIRIIEEHPENYEDEIIIPF
jgi:hypothetical protein